MKPRILFRAIAPDDYAEFTRRTSYHPGSQFGGVVAYHDDVIMGAIGLDGWTQNAVCAHWWIRHARCAMPLWHEVVKYVAQYGRRKIIGMTPSDNVRCWRMCLGPMGLTQTGIIKDGWSEGVDIIIMEYQINARHERTAQLHAAA